MVEDDGEGEIGVEGGGGDEGEVPAHSDGVCVEGWWKREGRGRGGVEGARPRNMGVGEECDWRSV